MKTKCICVATDHGGYIDPECQYHNDLSEQEYLNNTTPLERLGKQKAKDEVFYSVGIPYYVQGWMAAIKQFNIEKK